MSNEVVEIAAVEISDVKELAAAPKYVRSPLATTFADHQVVKVMALMRALFSGGDIRVFARDSDIMEVYARFSRLDEKRVREEKKRKEAGSALPHKSDRSRRPARRARTGTDR